MQGLELLKRLVHGMTAQFDSSCEVVIHDLTRNDLDSSIVYTGNEHMSNRQLGDGPSETVLETSNNSPERSQDKLSYLVRIDDGHILKSGTVYICSDDARVSYILSSSYDITGLITMDKALKGLIPTNSEPNKQPRKITHNADDPLDVFIEQSVAPAGEPVALMTKDDKAIVIQFLNDPDVFLTTKSGDKVSSYFGISKFTLYSYMSSGREGKDTKDSK